VAKDGADGDGDDDGNSERDSESADIRVASDSGADAAALGPAPDAFPVPCDLFGDPTSFAMC